jgi:hydrogenase-4 component B
MPFTGACFTAGALAIAGLPPLNGFNSEWLLYRGLFGTALDGSGAVRVASLIAAALFALVGGLAAACMVRLLGMAFLGAPRDPSAAAAHEGGLWLRAPLALLLAACAALAVLPVAAVSALGPVARELLGPDAASAEALAATTRALTPIGTIAAASWLGLALGWPVLALLRGRRPAPDETWGCGYAAPSTRMQYSACSFSQLFAERLLPRPLAPRVLATPVRGPFPDPVQFATEEGDPITRGGYEPVFGAIARRFARLRVLQQGNAHLYLAYILIAVLASLLWTSLRARWLP